MWRKYFESKVFVIRFIISELLLLLTFKNIAIQCSHFYTQGNETQKKFQWSELQLETAYEWSGTLEGTNGVWQLFFTHLLIYFNKVAKYSSVQISQKNNYVIINSVSLDITLSLDYSDYNLIRGELYKLSCIHHTKKKQFLDHTKRHMGIKLTIVNEVQRRATA